MFHRYGGELKANITNRSKYLCICLLLEIFSIDLKICFLKHNYCTQSVTEY